MKLSFTNLLPGTYFALFGTVIIGIMLWKGEPPQWNEKNAVTLPGGGTISSEKLMRAAGCQINLDSVDAEWTKLRQPGVTLTDSAEPLHNIACFYWKEKRIGEAVSLARLAALYGKDADKPIYLNLLAELLQANGNKDEAAKTIQAAEAMQKQGE